jgi:hypothetical protein
MRTANQAGEDISNGTWNAYRVEVEGFRQSQRTESRASFNAALQQLELRASKLGVTEYVLDNVRREVGRVLFEQRAIISNGLIDLAGGHFLWGHVTGHGVTPFLPGSSKIFTTAILL